MADPVRPTRQPGGLVGRHATLDDDPDRVNRRIAEYTSITPDEVAEAAAAHLRPDQRAVLTYEIAGTEGAS